MPKISEMYAQVVFPLPFRNSFTYFVPKEFRDSIKVGQRVVVPFGKRVLTGFVIGISDTTDLEGTIKPLRDILDDNPIFDKDSIKFYEWLADYYISSIGEALRYSVPYGTDVESKKKVVADTNFCAELFHAENKKNSVKARLLSILSVKEVHKISQLQKELKKKNIYYLLSTLEKTGAVTILNEIENAKVGIKKVKFVKFAKPVDDIYAVIPEIESRSPKQVVLLLELLSQKEDIPINELLKKTKSNRSSLNSLAEKGLIEIFEKEVDRVYTETYKEAEQEFELSLDQKNIISEINKCIDENRFEPYLVHGVTGSGKTQVYIELAKQALSKNKTVLILVPEISLTPQITSRFFNSFGNIISVLHSRMSLGERYDSWRGVVDGKYRVVIGPRSALFAPLKNIGLIVVDEEHDQSYKQYDMVPKYNARDAAVILARFNKSPVVLGSATPSIESMFNAKSGKYKLLTLKERVDNAKMPIIKLIDVTIEKKRKKMENVFSRALLDKISDRIKKKEGVIILQNRRGFATQVFCDDCGEIVMCPDCSVSMVHHINKNILQCHYCGIVKPVPKACPNCGSLSLKFFGTGTQKVEDELEYFFPSIKIERIDSDSISRKGKLGEILNQFRKGEIDILVGTQMVSKGMDFSHVTLVGVVSAETSLWLPDFRADERTFQLLTQVAGRAGRSKVEGEVIIQTQNHKHWVLQKVLATDYESFYNNEIQLRMQNGYPPFTRLCLIETKDENETHARGAIKEFYEILKTNSKGIQLNIPGEAIISKIKGQYRFHLVVKSDRKVDPSGRLLRNGVMNSFITFNRKSRFKDVKLLIDIDPQSIV